MKTIKPLLTIFLIAVFLQNCTNSPTKFPSTDYGEDRQVTSSKSALLEAGIDPEKIDELTSHLRPYLNSTIADRRLENWYVNEANWIETFQNKQNILYTAEIVYNDYLEKGEFSEASKVKNAISRLHSKSGNFLNALEACELSIELANRAKDSISMGWSMAGISMNFTFLNEFLSAEEYSKKTLEFARSINNPSIEAGILNILGAIKASQTKYDTAIVVLNESIKIARQQNLTELEKRGVLNVSFSYNKLNCFEESINFLIKNTDFRELPNSITNMFLCYNLQSAYLGKRDFAKATYYLNQGCQMANELGFIYAKFNCETYRKRLFKEQGFYELAFIASEKVNEINMELTGLEQIRPTQSMKVRLSLQDKNFEIAKRKEEGKVYQIRLKGSLAIIAFLSLFIPVIYFFMRSRQKQKIAEQEKQVAEAKLQALQSQMHPHFIFNALGGVQNYILKSEKIQAYKYLGKFATLLRSITKSTTQVHIELDQEIEFIQSYLDMEKLRFRDDFTYTLSVDPALMHSKKEIPSMVIQPVVENALLHGLAGLDRQGKLSIEIRPDDKEQGIWCVVMDNGRGRVAAEKNSRGQEVKGHLSIATINTSERIKCLRRLGYDKVDANIDDLYENDKATGTKVTLYLPFMHEDQLVTA